jgi:membrane-associated protein
MELIHSIAWFFSAPGIEWLIRTGGLPVICFFIFAETGFFALLPGDSMLVLCGMLANTTGSDGQPVLPLYWLMALVPFCGVLGDQVGFWIGTIFGKAIYRWPDFYLWKIPVFRQVYLTRTKEFYSRWGVYTIMAGRWVPFVRTFAPIVAGITKMRFRTFITFNIVGAITWVWSMIFVGYFITPLVEPLVKKVWPNFTMAANIEKLALIIVLLSLIPIVHTIWKESKERKDGRKSKPRRRR